MTSNLVLSWSIHCTKKGMIFWFTVTQKPTLRWHLLERFCSCAPCETASEQRCVTMEFQQKLGRQSLFDINKLRYECINNHQHIINLLYNHYSTNRTPTPAFLGQWCSQETSATSKEDLEDFVQWRRRQPGNAKAMVSAECEARMSRFIISEPGCKWNPF